MRHLSSQIAKLMQPAARKRGFANVDLFHHWPDIIGADYAEHCDPVKLQWPRRDPRKDAPDSHAKSSGAVLTVAVAPAHAIAVQHEVPRLIRRINSVFGYPAIGRIRVVRMLWHVDRQPLRTRRRCAVPLANTATPELNLIDNPDLKLALAQLRQAIRAQK